MIMKEFSIEEKAKAYDKALEMAKKLIENEETNVPIFYVNNIKDIFPELKGSEDEMVEKIRKDIISYLNNRQITSIAESSATEKWLAWIEKQGEPLNESVYDTEDKEIYQAISIGLTDMFDEYGWSDFGGIPIKNILNWLEKQGEQKTIWHDKDEEPCEDRQVLICLLGNYYVDFYHKEDKRFYMFGLPKHYLHEIEKWAYIDDLLEKQGELKSSKWTDGDVVRHGGVLALVTNGRNAMKSNCEQITIQYPDEWVKAERKERKYFFEELGKQGEQKPIISNDALREGIAHFGITQYQIDNWLKKYVDIEKQDEQKPVFEMKTPEESLGIDSDTYNKIVDECIYGEQKPADTCDSSIINGKEFPAGEKRDFGYFEENSADNVEPKFKIEKGKWYVCTQTFVLRGKEVIIKGQAYQADKDNVIKGEEGCRFIDRHDGKASDYLRSWTIADAKDGEVLAFYSEYKGNKMVQVGIIEKYVGKHGGCSNAFKIYVGVNWDNNLQIGDYMGCSDIRPATKEQCDLLFSKMKEADYEWDAEKKEPKKIKNIEIPFGAKDSELQEATYFIPKGFHAEIDDDKIVIKKGEKPTTWSEEDEEMLEDVRDNFEYNKGEMTDSLIAQYDKFFDKIKFFKSQPKQKWSEEDEKILNDIDITIFEENSIPNVKYWKFMNWLKSLKQRIGIEE